ncbi:MAG: DeoR/GlpR transcriptional regulator [Ruminococcaceae bacterium]|nr:DeoR/GlpR transcriptional regulator [Oscillospiraceae bacterium]
MFAPERHKRILELLNAEGAVMVSRLSTELGVTEETVRRDLEKLEAQELLSRTHGGALPIDGGTYEYSLEKRKGLNVESKQALAREAVQYISAGDTVFLDASTTTFYLSRELKNMRNVTVITNSIRVVNELMGVEGIKVIAVGGIVSNNQSFVGTMAESHITDNYFADKMFFSSKGLSETAGILESNEHECYIKQKMLKNSKQHYYLCDKSKIGRIGFVKLAPFDSLDYLITDAYLSEGMVSNLTEAGVEIVNI